MEIIYLFEQVFAARNYSETQVEEEQDPSSVGIDKIINQVRLKKIYRILIIRRRIKNTEPRNFIVIIIHIVVFKKNTFPIKY